MNFDLHVHTNFSACASKENTWEELLKKAEEQKIELLSVTDHNSCLFHVIRMFLNVNSLFSGKIITGMECDVVENGVAFELLAYNFDAMNAFNWAFKTYGTLETRQNFIKSKLITKIKRLGIVFDFNKEFNGKVEYAHNFVYENLMSFKENKGFFNQYRITSSSEFYRASTGDKNFPLYVDLNELWPNVKRVVKAIHKAGGIVVLAHPFNYNENIDVKKLLNIVLKAKLDGVEVYHPSCDENQIKLLLDFAQKHNLIITGGSDYHGNVKHNEIGINNTIKDITITSFMKKL